MANWTHLELESEWVNAGGPEASANVAAAVALAESRGDPDALANTAYPSKPKYRHPSPGARPEYSVGFWQINLLAHPQYSEADMRDPIKNARAAVAISAGGTSFHAWSTYTNGAYKDYLADDAPATPPPPQATSPAGSVPGGSLAGWRTLTAVLARDVPRQLARSQQHRTATLRLIAARRRVR